MSDERAPYGLDFPAPRPIPRSVWERADSHDDPPPQRTRFGANAVLFFLTVLSVSLAGALQVADPAAPLPAWPELPRFLLSGWRFALPLLSILLVHEFGHYIAARLHGVDASLPYFLPLPLLSPFGTLGAVIAMRGRIRSRNALLDIGASGPLAGLVVAIPVLALGLSWSTVTGHTGEHYTQEGQSLLYLALKRVVVGPIPDGHDVNLHPTAFAGWAGFLVTMLNLLPWGQLDGGHVAYALFGRTQHRIARWFRAALLPLFLYNAVKFLLPVALGQPTLGWVAAFASSNFWLVWYVVLGIIARASGGAQHPPTEPGELSPVRRFVAVVTLICFVLLFMPTPWALY